MTLAKRDEFDFDFGIDMSDMMMIIMMVIMVTVLTSVTTTSAQTAQTLQAQAYTGLTDNRILRATPVLQWVNLISDPPYTPWITASFHNDGWTENDIHSDWSVFIGINNPDELHEIASGEDYEVNMSGGDRRIELIFFRAGPGQRASVRTIGKY